MSSRMQKMSREIEEEESEGEEEEEEEEEEDEGGGDDDDDDEDDIGESEGEGEDEEEGESDMDDVDDDEDDDNLSDDDAESDEADETSHRTQNSKTKSIITVFGEDVVDDLTYDTYNLAACSNHTIRFTEGANKRESLRLLTERSTQLLVKRIFECPRENSDTGLLALLPNEIFKLPREKRIPEVQPDTRWERFAKDKGIKKKKRERMVYDEDSDEFKPRYGYKRTKNGIEDIPIVEIKTGQDPYADPWAIERSAKKERISKNAKNQLKNTLRASGKKYGSLKNYDSAAIPGIPIDIDSKGKGSAAAKTQRGKKGVQSALQLVQHSTASMGRFDVKRQGEPAIALKGKKHTFRENNVHDQDHMKAQIRFVADKADKKAKGVTNSLSAYEGILPDAPTDAFRQKKGKGKAPKAKGGGEVKRKASMHRGGGGGTKRKGPGKKGR